MHAYFHLSPENVFFCGVPSLGHHFSLSALDVVLMMPLMICHEFFIFQMVIKAHAAG